MTTQTTDKPSRPGAVRAGGDFPPFLNLIEGGDHAVGKIIAVREVEKERKDRKGKSYTETRRYYDVRLTEPARGLAKEGDAELLFDPGTAVTVSGTGALDNQLDRIAETLQLGSVLELTGWNVDIAFLGMDKMAKGEFKGKPVRRMFVEVWPA